MPVKKKILFIITKSNMGGASRYVFDLATGLPPEEYDVHVALGGTGPLKVALDAAGIETHVIQNFTRDVSFQREYRAYQELTSLIKSERPSIVHANSSKAGGLGALAARACGVERIVFTAHGWPFYEPKSLPWRALAWLFSYLTALLAHRIIVVSNHDYRNARMPGLMYKIAEINTALSPIEFKDRFDARATLFPRHIVLNHEQSTWFVSTGEHTGNKNLPALVAAIRELVARGTHNIFFTFMSDGEDRARLEALVRAYELQSYVYFTGFVPDARTYLKAFDVFVLPSLKEGFPYGLLEAGAAGLACIASNVGGIPEIIDHKKNGIVIDPYDHASLVEALHSCLESPDRLRTYGYALKEKVMSTYTLSHMLENIEDIYRK